MPVKAPSNRTAIILAADVVSYSKFMEQDQNGTIEAVKYRVPEFGSIFARFLGPAIDKGHVAVTTAASSADPLANGARVGDYPCRLHRISVTILVGGTQVELAHM